jgi:predicted amidophosphoribosyltransferase
VFSGLLSAGFGVRCAGCDRSGHVICPTCRLALLSPPGGVRPAVPVGPDGLIVAAPFTGRARRVVHGLKFRNRRAVSAHLGALLARRVLAAGLRPGIDITAVTWAPTSRARRRERGFDQAEAVARATARQLGLPTVRLLERAAGVGPQTGADRAERLTGPAFVSRRSRHRHLLLVDDVVTTGATLAAASGSLRTSGAVRVVCAAVAATPAPTGPARPVVRVGGTVRRHRMPTAA